MQHRSGASASVAGSYLPTSTPLKAVAQHPPPPSCFRAKEKLCTSQANHFPCKELHLFPSHSAGTNFGLEIILRFFMHFLSGMGIISPSLQMKLQRLTQGLPGREPRTWKGPCEFNRAPGAKSACLPVGPRQGLQ